MAVVTSFSMALSFVVVAILPRFKVLKSVRQDHLDRSRLRTDLANLLRNQSIGKEERANNKQKSRHFIICVPSISGRNLNRNHFPSSFTRTHYTLHTDDRQTLVLVSLVDKSASFFLSTGEGEGGGGHAAHTHTSQACFGIWPRRRVKRPGVSESKMQWLLVTRRFTLTDCVRDGTYVHGYRLHGTKTIG